MTAARRRSCVLLATTALSALLMVPSSGLGNGASSCVPDGFRVLKQNRVAVIVQDQETTDEFACYFAHGRLIRMNETGDEQVDLERLAGAFVAYELEATSGSGPTDRRIEVIDLVRRRTHAVRAVAECEAEEGSCQEFEDLVVTRTGSIAWIQNDLAVDRRVVRCEARCVRRGRGMTTLDRGRRIRLTSLRLSGSVVTWLNGSRRKRARLR